MVSTRLQLARNMANIFSPRQPATSVNDEPSTPSTLESISRRLDQFAHVVDGLAVTITNLARPVVSTPIPPPSQNLSSTTVSTPLVTSTIPPSNMPIAIQDPTGMTGAKLIPPIGKRAKYDFPSFSGDPTTFKSWKARFIAAISASELKPLYDRATESLVLYGVYVDDDNFQEYDVQLYARLLQALPDSSSFIHSTEFLSQGLALWHALLEDNNSTGNVHTTHLLVPAFYALHRNVGESVDDYWNRFSSHVRDIRRDPKAPKLDSEHLRQQFLITLGGVEFAFLKTDWENSSLDPKWMIYSDGELKSALRLIQQAKSSASVETVGSHGYANATKSKPDTTNTVKSDPGPDPCFDALYNLVVDQSKVLQEHSTLLREYKESRQRPRTNRNKYCYTHGLCSHTSKECNTRAADHQEGATFKNRMGGSTKGIKQE
jgi:hypothetical protein